MSDKYKDKIAYFLLTLLVISLLNSSIYFLWIKNLSFFDWFIVNVCAPSSTVFLTGYILYRIKKGATLLICGTFLITIFGIGGMIILDWHGRYIIAQSGHIIMIFNAAWVIYFVIVKDQYYLKWRRLIIISILMLALVIIHQEYINRSPELLNTFLNMSND